MNKIIFINDPVAGFIKIDQEFFLDIVNHPYFQRLRRIRQLGLTDLVFPGASHTRFQHTLGAFQLLSDVINILKMKAVEISDQEENAVLSAILLHDIGHGPFSHALESEIVENVSHEILSKIFLNYFNEKNGGELHLASQMFSNEYERHFFHSLISGQLDVDRLDYLRRDSFYTGVPEGMTGSERLIRMMNVRENQLVVEKKGVYTVENYLIARQSMYWQVYLHKAVIAAEQLLIRILRRAKFLARQGDKLFGSPALIFFLYHDISDTDFNNSEVLNNFALLEDNDILLAIKVWMDHSDFILSNLSYNLIHRILPAIEVSDQPFDSFSLENLRSKVKNKFPINEEDCGYFVYTDSIQNTMYDSADEPIKILNPDQTISLYKSALLNSDRDVLHLPVQKYFLCYPKQFKK